MGPRRGGKSVLLELFQNELRREGVDDEHMIAFNLEDFGFSDLQDPKKLHQTVLSRVKDNSRYFVFIDEIQWCKGFERVVDSLYLRKNLDIYITGSKAFLLSGELAILLTGRYLPIEVLPFSFSEQLSEKMKRDLTKTLGGTQTLDRFLLLFKHELIHNWSLRFMTCCGTQC